MFYFSGTRKPDFKSIKKIDYNNYWKERGFSINKKLKEREEIILKFIPNGSKVLDLGSGNSRLPLSLKENGCTVSVGDVSDQVLEGFKKFGIETLHVDLENSSASVGGSYDYIILSEVLEHTSNPEEILVNLKNFTKNFCLTIPNSAFYRYRIHLMFGGRFFTQWVYHPSEHLRYWSHSDFLDWLEALGLVVKKVESSNGLSLLGLPVHKWWPNLFGHQICYFVQTEK